MADDEEFDFFKPHPNPKPRVKASFFEVVPDAFDDKSLTFTGDHRRLPRKAAPETKEPEPEPEPKAAPEEEKPALSAAFAAMSGTAVQETMFSHDVSMTSAEPWSPGDRYFIDNITAILMESSFRFDDLSSVGFWHLRDDSVSSPAWENQLHSGCTTIEITGLSVLNFESP
ncbi:hypothetical protein ElyMa_003938900 [Elysia marginata]|uniref:Uncharacterized protein n=1 Tax=Elysia marginata TaxID=1093978 RepID=A0AAV4FU40_9GAST|nr:hypothetical protein ElyMa_003938900 [Elysia marginata]